MERSRLAQDHHRTVIPRRPRHFGLAVALGLAFAGFLGALFPGASRAAEARPASLHDYLAHPHFRHATWGVAVQDAASGKSLFETNAHQLLKPASNAKLVTGALALHTLGPNARLATDFIPTGPISPRGVLHGDLILHGGGDFAFSARFFQGNPTQSLSSVVATLKKAGLRRIQGDLVADDALFSGPPFGHGWTWDDLEYDYGAEVSALSVDDNVLELECAPGATTKDPVTVTAGPGASYFTFETQGLITTPPSSPRRVQIQRQPGSRVVRLSGSLPVGSQPWKDSVTVPEPALYFAHRLREELMHADVRVQGIARRDPGARQRLTSNLVPAVPGFSKAARDPLFLPPPISIASPPLSTLVTAMMKPSQNLYAQLLLLQVGARLPQTGDLPTEEAGILALRAFLDEAGIPRDEVQLDDGSGLSRSSLVSPAALVAVLRFVDRQPYRQAFLDSLPVAGRDGSLRQRFTGTPLEGNLRAKTGSLRYVHTLSGFVTNTAGRRLVFSAMLNAYAPSPSDPAAPGGRAALEGLVTRLAQSDFPDSP